MDFAVWLWLFFLDFGANEYMKFPIYFLSQKENKNPCIVPAYSLLLLFCIKKCL